MEEKKNFFTKPTLKGILAVIAGVLYFAFIMLSYHVIFWMPILLFVAICACVVIANKKIKQIVGTFAMAFIILQIRSIYKIPRMPIMAYLAIILYIVMSGIALTYLVFCFLKKEEWKAKISRFYLATFLPAFFIFIISIIDLVEGWGSLHSFSFVLLYLMIAFFICDLMEISFKNKATEKKAESGQDIVASDVYIDMTKHILLLLFTFGIWSFIWIYRTTAYTSSVSSQKRTPTNQLLLCLFVPFYQIYWIYVTAEILDYYSEDRKLRCEKFATPCLIAAIFVSFVAPILIQSRINLLEATNEHQETANTNE